MLDKHAGKGEGKKERRSYTVLSNAENQVDLQSCMLAASGTGILGKNSMLSR